MRLLNLPIPVFAAILAPQVEPPGASAMPAWVAAVAAWIFVLGWFLQAYSKLPGASGERRAPGACEDCQRKVAAMHEIVTREDADKPGWRMVWYPARETREIRDLLTELADLREDWAAEREECKRDRARMIAEHEQERTRMDQRLKDLEVANLRYETALRHGAGGAA